MVLDRAAAGISRRTPAGDLRWSARPVVHATPAGSARAAAHRFLFSANAEPFHVRKAEPRVYGYAWRRDAPAGTVTLVHGLQSHSQWFAESAELLWQRGFAVYVMDRRGSGSSTAARGDIQRYRDWFEEVAEVVGLARAEHPSLPAHVVGHCFGASVALGCALTHPKQIASLTIMSPGLYVLPDYPPREKARILGWGLLRPERRFPTVLRDDLFSGDPDVVAWIGQDALGARDFTARCLIQILAMNVWLRRNLSRLRVPLLVLEAERDRISHNPRNRRLLQKALGKRLRIASFDAEHLLLTEPCRDQVIDALIHWFEERR